MLVVTVRDDLVALSAGVVVCGALYPCWAESKGNIGITKRARPGHVKLQLQK